MPPLLSSARSLVRRVRRTIVGRSPSPSPTPSPEPEPESTPAPAEPTEPAYLIEPRSPMDCTEEEAERWNREWLRYFGREWRNQLSPHTDYPGKPDLADTPIEMLKVRVGRSPIHIYCAREHLANQRVMELGCGCANLGKLIARYVDTYLGVDYSPMALKVARLVSPENCTYVHVADRENLEPHFGAIDTIVSRHFWIHQNMKLGKLNLAFLARFLRPGGHLYCDFRIVDPDQKQFVVLTPQEPLSSKYPSATFEYSRADIDDLVEGSPFEIQNVERHLPSQRCYVTLRRMDDIPTG